MATTDLEIKEKWLERLTASPRQLVEMFVRRQTALSPQLKLQMVIWMNPTQDPWSAGVELIEICGNQFVSYAADFMPEMMPPGDGWPRRRIIYTEVRELVDEVAIVGVARSHAESIRRVLAQEGGKALVFPAIRVSPEADFRALVGGVV